MKRGIIISDLHCGNIGGLTHPKYMREDLKEIQNTFWSWFTKNIDKYKPFDFCLGLGDFTDGEGKKGTLDTVLNDIEDQALCAAEIIKTLEVPNDKIFLVRGTPFHSNGTNEYENIIAKELNCSISDTQKLEIEKWKIHTRHVVGRSDISYGQATPILKELARMEHESFLEKKESPDVILRGHVHYAISVNRDGIISATVPCLCLPIASANGRRYTAWFYTVGFSVIDLDENVEPIYRTVKMDVKLYHDEKYHQVSFEGDK